MSQLLTKEKLLSVLKNYKRWLWLLVGFFGFTLLLSFMISHHRFIFILRRLRWGLIFILFGLLGIGGFFLFIYLAKLLTKITKWEFYLEVKKLFSKEQKVKDVVNMLIYPFLFFLCMLGAEIRIPLEGDLILILPYQIRYYSILPLDAFNILITWVFPPLLCFLWCVETVGMVFYKKSPCEAKNFNKWIRGKLWFFAFGAVASAIIVSYFGGYLTDALTVIYQNFAILFVFFFPSLYFFSVFYYLFLQPFFLAGVQRYAKHIDTDLQEHFKNRDEIYEVHWKINWEDE